MLQPRREADLTLEAFDRHTRRHFRRQHLYHHWPAQRTFLGYEHPRHTTTPEFLLEGVGVAK
jgi:hypothetical protein